MQLISPRLASICGGLIGAIYGAVDEVRNPAPITNIYDTREVALIAGTLGGALIGGIGASLMVHSANAAQAIFQCILNPKLETGCSVDDFSRNLVNATPIIIASAFMVVKVWRHCFGHPQPNRRPPV